MAWRYYAQRILTGEWLDRDLAIIAPSFTWTLSGPAAGSATVDEITASTWAPDGMLVLDEWATAIYAEKDDKIRWGGILKSSTAQAENSRSLDIIGFAGYPKGRIYDSDYYRLWEADPFDIVRILWDFVQSDPTGDLGVTVDPDSCPIRIGDPSPGPAPAREAYSTSEAYDAALAEWTNYAGQPYELAWWNNSDCGQEIDNVITEAEAEYYEYHYWIDSAKTQVGHHIYLGWPHVGIRRDDLRFVEGENLIVPPYATRNGDEYANQITALGAGEERFKLRERAGRIVPGRLRRDRVVADTEVMTPSRLKQMAEEELKLAQDILYFDSFEIIDHPNAQIGSLNVGDEIRVQTYSGFEPIDRWVRVTQLTVSPEASDSIQVSVTRL